MIFSMKKILVPVDFSECSKLAVEYAANLVRKVSGELLLLHVLEIGETDSSLGSSGSWAGAEEVTTVPYMIARLKMVKKQMEDFIAEAGLEKIPVHDFAEVGEPHVRINEAAAKHHADLIVMGTHGVSGMKELFVGSVTEKVVQHTNRPVLSIKEKVELNPERILFASDFSEEADQIFNRVSDFASVFHSTIYLLKVIDSDSSEKREKSLAQLHAFAVKHHVPHLFQTILYAKSTEEGILRFAKNIQAGVIAIGTHGRRGLARFFNGSVSEELVNHSFCPVLTVNFREEK
jgi:nucleotide-binding universal stress UspA family protein